MAGEPSAEKTIGKAKWLGGFMGVLLVFWFLRAVVRLPDGATLTVPVELVVSDRVWKTLRAR